jgi:hypothetical protein
MSTIRHDQIGAAAIADHQKRPDYASGRMTTNSTESQSARSGEPGRRAIERSQILFVGTDDAMNSCSPMTLSTNRLLRKRFPPPSQHGEPGLRLDSSTTKSVCQ